jgi:hypothetical protein
MYELARMTDNDIAECGSRIAAMGANATTMEDVANEIVGGLYDGLGGGPDGGKACALVRFYKTHAYDGLDASLRGFADAILGDTEAPANMQCLTLLATVGDDPAWNSRAESNGHKAIPLPSEDFVSRIPMVARLVGQLGLDVSAVLRPDPAIMVDLEGKQYNVFHVPEAVGSPYIPAQDDFVIPHGVRSVLGFGGLLSSGELYVVILFAKVTIPRETAERFEALALNVKSVAERFADKEVFAAA